MLTVVTVVGLVAYRCTRFAIYDTLIEEPRARVLHWLAMRQGWWSTKLHDLFTCPYCISVYFAAAATAVADATMSVPAPVLTWIAGCGSCMVIWRWAES